MYTHCAVYVTPDVDIDLVKEAINSMKRGATLDVILSAPATIEETEVSVGILYGLAPRRPSELNYTVFFRPPTDRHWEHTFGKASDNYSTDHLRLYASVAVGGTWDHMHWGHRLMLTMAAETANDRVIIGVTASESLKHKKYAGALESYAHRASEAEQFVRTLRPDVRINSFPLEDMYGPTITVEDIQALVVSHETKEGGRKVNDKREELGWNRLDIIEVGSIGEGESGKSSSTDFRREAAEKEKKANKS